MNYGTMYGLLIFVGLLAIGIVAEFVVEDPDGGLTGITHVDTNRLPPSAAGGSALRGHQPNCEGVIYQAAFNGIKYVRESGGGVIFAAEINNQFGFYKLKNGRLVSVDRAAINQGTMAKLKYALYHCEELLMSSGTYIYTAVDQPVDSRVVQREGPEMTSIP